MVAPRLSERPTSPTCVCMLPAQVLCIHSEFVQICERDCLAARAVLNGEYTGPLSGTLTISGSSDGSSTPLRFTHISVKTLYHPDTSESPTDFFSTRQCCTSDLWPREPLATRELFRATNRSPASLPSPSGARAGATLDDVPI